MKPIQFFHSSAVPVILATAFLFSGCSSAEKKQEAPVYETGDGKAVVDSEDDWEEIEGVVVSDPIEALNRATFMLNHGIYTVVLRPVSSAYRFVFPSLVRKGIHNAYENVRFPVRFVNHTLQGEFVRAGQETGKFLVDTTIGIGGLMKPSDKIPALGGVPTTSTAATLTKWGLGHGPYLVVPLIGPTSGRDVVGLIGDAGLNPVSWAAFVFGGAVWTVAITTPNTVRSFPDQMDAYDAATKDALDRYIAARTAYIQFSNAKNKPQ